MPVSIILSIELIFQMRSDLLSSVHLLEGGFSVGEDLVLEFLADVFDLDDGLQIVHLHGHLQLYLLIIDSGAQYQIHEYRARHQSDTGMVDQTTSARNGTIDQGACECNLNSYQGRAHLHTFIAYLPYNICNE